MTRNYLKLADAGVAMPFAIIGNSPSSAYNYPKPATAGAKTAPPTNPPKAPPMSVVKAAGYSVYHHCKECKEPYGGAT